MPLAALFELILAVLAPLGRDFGTQVAPTWAPGPSLTISHTFQEITKLLL